MAMKNSPGIEMDLTFIISFLYSKRYRTYTMKIVISPMEIKGYVMVLYFDVYMKSLRLIIRISRTF